jgi:hypothetical protein
MTVIKWLELYYLQSGSLHFAERLVEKYLRILRTRGKKEAISWCKTRRLSILQWLTTIDSLQPKTRFSSKVRLPRDLRFLKTYKKIGHPDIRLILSSLYLSRGLRLPVDTNTDHITKEPT